MITYFFKFFKLKKILSSRHYKICGLISPLAVSDSVKVPSKYQKAILYRTYLFSQVGNAEVMTLDAGRLNRTGYRARHVHSYGSCHVATQHSTITILFSFCVQK